MAARKTAPKTTAKKTTAPAASKKKKAEAVTDAAPAVPQVEVEAAPVVTEAAPVVDSAPAAVEPMHVKRSEFTQWVREAAFKLAQDRHFRNGSPTEDWLQAEAYLTQQLAHRGVSIVD